MPRQRLSGFSILMKQASGEHDLACVQTATHNVVRWPPQVWVQGIVFLPRVPLPCQGPSKVLWSWSYQPLETRLHKMFILARNSIWIYCECLIILNTDRKSPSKVKESYFLQNEMSISREKRRTTGIFFLNLIKKTFRVEFWCDGRVLQCRRNAALQLLVALTQEGTSEKKNNHRLYSSSVFPLPLFPQQSLCLFSLYTRQWRLFPSNVPWDVLSPWAVPFCKHKLPERYDTDTQTEKKSDMLDRELIHKSCRELSSWRTPPQRFVSTLSK